MDFAALLKEAWDKFLAEIVQLALFALLGTLLCFTLILIPTVVGGWFRATLGYVRNGTPPAFEELWNFDDYFPILLLLVLGGIAVSIGYMLLFIPGVLLSTLWLYAIFFLVDKNMGVIESFGASKDAVLESGFVNHLIILLIIGVLGALGGAAWGLGTLFTTPFGIVLLSISYLDLEEAQ